MKRNIFCGVLMCAFVLSATAYAEAPSAKATAPASKTKLNSAEGTKFYNPNGTKFFYDLKFEWPKWEFPKFFESQPAENAPEDVASISDLPVSASGSEDSKQVLNELGELGKVMESFRQVMASYVASLEKNAGDKKMENPVKQLGAEASAVSQLPVSSETNLSSLMQLLKAQNNAQAHVDPAKALEMANAVREKNEAHKRQVEEEVRRMEEGY